MSDVYLLNGFALLKQFLVWFLGDLGGVVKLLIVLAVIDQISGLIKAAILGQWSSQVGFHGIARKIFMFMLVGIANIVDNEMFGHSEALRDIICLFYVANESISIIENAIESGLPVPEGFKERFMVWRNKKLISKNSPSSEDD